MNKTSPGFSLRPEQAAQWQQIKTRWQALGERERFIVQLGAAALGLLLLWSAAVQPALRTLRAVPSQLNQLDVQLQQMQRLAQEARELREQPAVPAAQSMQALKAASEHLGPAARLSISGERAVLSLSGVSSEALQEWLTVVRSAARARPVEATLQRGPQGFTGSIVLALGAPA